MYYEKHKLEKKIIGWMLGRYDRHGRQFIKS